MFYEYKCSCENIEEVSMKMTDEHPASVKCSKCGKKALRYFSASPIIPDYMRAGQESPFNYEKSSQIHWKKYY